jgi:hypothetical protein
MKSFMIYSGNDLGVLRQGSERRFYRKVEFSPAIRRKCGDVALTSVAAGLNRHLNACGCGLASLFVALTIAGSTVAYGMSWLTVISTSWTSAVVLFALLCGAAITGKLIGLAYSEWQFRRFLHHAEEILKSDLDEPAVDFGSKFL